MIKTISLISIVLFINNIANAKKYSSGLPADSSKDAAVMISPSKPLIEKDIYGYYLNFDITIKNQSKHVIELSSMEVSVIDGTGKLVLRKFINSDGQSSGIELLGNTLIKPGETISIFNPFHTFSPDVTITTLKYGFFFDYADTQKQKDNNNKRLPIDFDIATLTVIKPEVYIARNSYYLPLKGRLIVWDGHDFYSHNRRSPISIVNYKETKDISSNSSRYAYNLMNVDGNGSMYHSSPFKKQDWYVFGNAVYVPSDGKIVAVENNIPDNEFNGKAIGHPKSSIVTDPNGMGNFVIIEHSNGEYSELLHLEIGSISVKPGDMVKAGQKIGKVGFSGNIMYPQLNYSVTNGIKELASEGVPSYFNNYKLYRGNVIVDIKRSRIDSGDIVESDK